MATIRFEINGTPLGDPTLSEEDKIPLTNAKNFLEQRLSVKNKEQLKAYIGSFTVSFGPDLRPQIYRSKSVFRFQEDAGLYLEHLLRDKVSEFRFYR